MSVLLISAVMLLLLLLLIVLCFSFFSKSRKIVLRRNQKVRLFKGVKSLHINNSICFL